MGPDIQYIGAKKKTRVRASSVARVCLLIKISVDLFIIGKVIT